MLPALHEDRKDCSLAVGDHSRYEAKYRAYYDAGIEFVSTRGYDEGYVAFLSEQRQRRKLMECGCGEGFAAAMAARLGYEVLAIDSAPSAIAKAALTHSNKCSNLRFQVGDVCNLGHIEPDSYDILADIGCLHMIADPQDALQYMAHAYRVLRTLGHIFLQNRVTADEAKIWFPNMAKWIDDWVSKSKRHYGETVREVFQQNDRDIAIDVPVDLGAISRSTAEYIALVTQAGFQVEHACVKTGGANSPFELVVIAIKPALIAEAP